MFVGFGVAAEEVLEAGTHRRRRGRGGEHSAKPRVVVKNGEQAVEHAMGGFANREDADVWKAAKIIGALRTAELMAGDRENPFDGCRWIDGFEGAAENLTGEVFAVHRLQV